MNNILSERLGRLSTSATLAMSQKSSELKAQGIDIINMSVGEPDFNTPDHIKAAGIKAIEEPGNDAKPGPDTSGCFLKFVQVTIKLAEGVCDAMLNVRITKRLTGQLMSGNRVNQSRVLLH